MSTSGYDVPEPSPVEADSSENDSALGEDETTYTNSLRSSLLATVLENGRGYHKYRDGIYQFPQDEREQDRLDLQHEMFLKLFDRKLLFSPLGCPPSNALDLGTGTGVWAIDFADQYPGCQVLGWDLSPIQPSWVPPNCKFEVYDFDSDWTIQQKFDVVHARLLLGTTSDPRNLFQKVYDSLAPGGWFELQELYMPFLCDDGTIPPDSAWKRWNDMMVEGMLKLQRDVRWAAQYAEWMRGSGFLNVTERIFKVPINTWPKDRFLKTLGCWNLVNMIDGLEAFSLRLFNKVLGVSVEDIELLLMDVRKDLHNKRIHSYWRMYIVFGQKPQ